MKLLLSLQLRGHMPINILGFSVTIWYTTYHTILEVLSTSSDSRMKNQGSSSATCPWCSFLKQGSEEHDTALPLYLASSYLIGKPADRHSTSKRKHHSFPFSSLLPTVLKSLFVLCWWLTAGYSCTLFQLLFTGIPFYSIHGNILQGGYARKSLIKVTNF